jgi:hypothetical protein
MIQKSFIDKSTCRYIHSAYEKLKVEGMQTMSLDTYEALEAILTTTQSAVLHEEDWSSFCVLYMDKNGLFFNPGVFGGLPMSDDLESRPVSDMLQRGLAVFSHIEATNAYITLSHTVDLQKRIDYIERIGFKVVEANVREEPRLKRIFHFGIAESDLVNVYYIEKEQKDSVATVLK